MIAITLDNFQQAVVEESKTKLVLVCFWAEQIPESVELRDKLASRLSTLGEHITLATVDCQSQAQIAQQFGIQGLPTAILLKDAQPLDGISGPQDDASIATFLDKHLPKPQDVLLKQAKEALANNQVTEAQNAIVQAYQYDDARADIKLVFADVCLKVGKTADAKTLVDSILMVDQNSDYHAIVAKIELAQQAENSPEIQALEAQLQATPDDVNLSHQLAAQYSQVNRQEDALAVLFRLVQAGDKESKEQSKELFLDVLKALPDGDPLAIQYRRKLYTLMY